jgi:hypothetical protein
LERKSELTSHVTTSYPGSAANAFLEGNSSTKCTNARGRVRYLDQLFEKPLLCVGTLQGVDIQLRILQTLLSLTTNFPTIHSRADNSQTYVLSFRVPSSLP